MMSDSDATEREGWRAYVLRLAGWSSICRRGVVLAMFPFSAIGRLSWQSRGVVIGRACEGCGRSSVCLGYYGVSGLANHKAVRVASGVLIGRLVKGAVVVMPAQRGE